MTATITQRLLLLILTIALFVTIFYHSGRTPSSLLLLELLALSSLLIAGWSVAWRRQVNTLTWLLLIIALFTPIAYLYPLSLEQWQALPGREHYSNTLEWLQSIGQTEPFLALSLVPYKTLHAALALFALIVLFLATVSLHQQQLVILSYLLLFIAFLQAVLGLAQYTNPNATWFTYLGLESTGGMSQGTYRNRDHFAALMIVALPITIALTLYNFGSDNSKKGKKNSKSDSIESRLNSTLLFGILTIILLLAATFSRSRAGVGLAVLAILISTPVFARRLGGGRTLGMTATLVGLGVGIAASIGLLPVLSRLVHQNPVEDARWLIFDTTITAIQNFFPFGSGPGTFQAIYRTFQPIEQLGFINHAHNDYLELILETGMAGIVILALILISYISGWIQMIDTAWDEIRIIKTAAGISLLLFMLHASLDFISHTPANALVFIILAGIFLKKPKEKEETKKKRKANHHPIIKLLNKIIK